LEYLPNNKTGNLVTPSYEEDPLAYEMGDEVEECVPGRTWSVRLAVADCKVVKNGNIILIKDPSGLEFRLREQKFNFSLVF
jgi:hypothetical protein